MVRLYLAHPFPAREWVRRWELHTEKKIGIELINPFYDATRNDVRKIDSGRAERYDVDPVSIVEGDVELICGSDGVFAIVSGDLSYGTIMEMVYARNCKKPVYSLITNGEEMHPWLRYHSKKIFTKLDDAELFLGQLVKGGSPQ